jgi:hypothetical protein
MDAAVDPKLMEVSIDISRPVARAELTESHWSRATSSGPSVDVRAAS